MRSLTMALALGVSLGTAGFGAVTAQASTSTVERTVLEKAATINLLHRKAKKALVTVAQDKSFGSYFSAHSHAEQHEAKERIEKISLATQSKFAVEEMCLIDPQGSEITRIVGREIADDLSNEEASAVFFEPGFAQRPRKVHISPLYMSPDADKWVYAYVTPVVLDGDKKAILHYEHGLDVYQEALNKGLEGSSQFVVAVNTDGWTVFDSRKAVPVEKQGDSEDPASSFEQFEFAGMDVEQLRVSVQNGGGKNSGFVASEDGAYLVAFESIDHLTIFAFEKQQN